MVATSSDKGLLKAPSLDKFKQYLTDIGMDHRPGKGEYQVLQVKCGVSWLAICRDARGYLTTPIELRLAVNNFYSGATPVPKPSTKLQPKPREHFLEDLRDDIAIQAMQSLLARPFTQDEAGRPFVEWVSEMSYEVADAMLAARAHR